MLFQAASFHIYIKLIRRYGGISVSSHFHEACNTRAVGSTAVKEMETGLHGSDATK